MKFSSALLVTVLTLGCAGCMNDQTKAMAETCQHLLGVSDQSGVKYFIEDAEERLESLHEPQNKVGAYIRNIQDPEAMTHKPILEQCLWRLKSQQS